MDISTLQRLDANILLGIINEKLREGANKSLM